MEDRGHKGSEGQQVADSSRTRQGRGAEELACSSYTFLLLLFAVGFARSVKNNWSRLECSDKVFQFCFGPVNPVATFFKENHYLTKSIKELIKGDSSGTRIREQTERLNEAGDSG